MRHIAAITLTIAIGASAAFARETIGVHGRWGAFRENAARRCFAIARPVTSTGNAAAALIDDPARGIRSQLSIRLSRARSPSAAVTLSVGERRFDLVAGTRTAWAASAADDRAILGAIRGARSMSVETMDAAGRPFADTYALKGAATAIDAAAVACLSA